jgi:hypothetical protein
MPFTFNSGDSTELIVKFKSWIQTGVSTDSETEWYVDIFFRKSTGGAYSNYWFTPNPYLDSWATEGQMLINAHRWRIKGSRTVGSNLVEFSKSFDLGQVKSAFNTNDKLIIAIRPPYQVDVVDGDTTYSATRIVRIGDFEVNIKTENEDNQYLYGVNSGFVNKKSIDLNIFDISNLNYKNGIYLSDDTKTSATTGWTDDGGSTTDSLIDHHVKSEVGYSYKTRRSLSGSIIFNTEVFIKPLTLLTDDNLSGLQFLVKEYSHNIPTGEYLFRNIDEYSTEKGDIVVI